ncbi:hypothetical protein EYF80_050742 [Liparis tanakae]|uniref:Uncharacterized protein n=1 Tax=Liparis tanakae TaxID=230148 RepID=A0A4Z2FD37_9TELE|nr:hypothetical protein EYF80_050742 [Liparis tanakae]
MKTYDLVKTDLAKQRDGGPAMLRRRSSSASVYAVLLLLLLLLPGPAARLCTRDLLHRVQTLIGLAPQQERTLGSTLRCFGEEVQVLLDEWQTDGLRTIRGFRFRSNIQDLAEKLNLTEAGGVACECHSEQSAGKFLDELRLTFERINNDFSSRC